MRKFDAIIIGTGQAGPSLAVRLANEGKKVAIVERKLFGGTCVNNGCTPTKSLVASARAAYMARRGGDFGVEISGSISVDMKKVKHRKDEIAGGSSKSVEEWLRATENLEVIQGHAKLESNRTVLVGDEELEADQIFINVGGRAVRLPGFDGIDYLTNTSMMEIDTLPEHLIIIGGSYIGLEFGQMYRRFGSKVTIIEMGPRLLGREDEDVSEAITGILENEGIEIRLNATCISGKKLDNGIIVDVDCESGDPQVKGSHLLMAVGRQPNTNNLGLEKAGVETDERGYIIVDDQLQTNVEGIWALGDCNRKGAFTHTSYNDFEIVAANLFDNDPRRASDRITCYGLFIDPPLGRVGMNEAEALKSGKNVLVGYRPMTRIARAVERGETQGFMKIYVDADSKEILGATILGIGGDEVIHSIIDIMYAKAPYSVIQRAVHIHPTVSELIPTMLGELKPLNESLK